MPPKIPEDWKAIERINSGIREVFNLRSLIRKLAAVSQVS
jgi:hypothetical protein